MNGNLERHTRFVYQPGDSAIGWVFALAVAVALVLGAWALLSASLSQADAEASRIGKPATAITEDLRLGGSH